MQEVLVKISTQGEQKEKERHRPGKPVAELPQCNCHAQVPARYQNDGKGANVVVWGWKKSCGKEQVPDGDDPVRDDDE